MSKQQVKSFLAGVLVANSLPHLGSAAAGKQQMTPLAGKTSSPGVNLVWGAVNLLGGLAVLRASTDAAEKQWDEEKTSFASGIALFSLWAALAAKLRLFK